MPRRKKGSHAVFAQRLASVLADTETEDGQATSQLAGDILYDMQCTVDIHVDHPALARAYILAALEKMDNDEVNNRRGAKEYLGHLRELASGCSDERFAEIYALYHPEPGVKKIATIEETEGSHATN